MRCALLAVSLAIIGCAPPRHSEAVTAPAADPGADARIQRLRPLVESLYRQSAAIPGGGLIASDCEYLIIGLSPRADRWRVWQMATDATQHTMSGSDPRLVALAGAYVGLASAYGAALVGEVEMYDRHIRRAEATIRAGQ